MTRGLRPISTADLNALLSQVATPHLLSLLARRRDGHCMRVTDLSAELATLVCTEVRRERPAAEVYVLAGDESCTPEQMVTGQAITGTKLVELRNPLPDGSLRSPLMVFIPAGLHAAAEDSFSNATFEHVNLGNIYAAAHRLLLEQFPADVAELVEAIYRRLQALSLRPSDYEWTRYLLTIAVNGYDASYVGAALYELGLIPDFGLHKPGVDLNVPLRRNAEKTSLLSDTRFSERHRALSVGVTDVNFRQQLAQSLRDYAAGGLRGWLRRVAEDPAQWHLAFHQWRFDASDLPPDQVHLAVTHSDLPVATEADRSKGLEPEQAYLPLRNGPKKIKVHYQVHPGFAQVTGVAKVVADIVSADQGPLGISTTRKAPARGDKGYVEFQVAKLERAALETGWYYVRIRPFTADNLPVNLLDEAQNPLPWGGTQDNPNRDYPNELWFYVATDLEVPSETQQRAIPRERSLEVARAKLRATNVTEKINRPVTVDRLTWLPERQFLEISFGRDGLYHLPVSAELMALERELLEHPLDMNHLTLTVDVRKGIVTHAREDARTGRPITALRVFQEARETYFALVRGDHHEGGEKHLITQAAPFHQEDVAEAARQYAATYQDAINALAEQKDFVALRGLLTLDSVRVILQGKGSRREAAIIAPTHPLRAIWFAAWARLASRWTEEPLTTEVRRALFDGFDEHAFPPVLPNPEGRLLTPAGELAPGWTLCTLATERDPRGLLAELCLTLGLPEPVGEDGVRAEELSRRMRRYLIQHPYIDTLIINAFNAGQAGVLARALVGLQKNEELEHLRYDVRLFVDDPLAPGVGTALAALLMPSDRATDQAAEAFSLPTGETLRPKLAFSVRPTAAFRDHPQEHRAHLSFLFDAFPPAEVTAARASRRQGAAPLHGLIQQYQVQYTETDALARWEKKPVFGMADPIDPADELTAVLSTAPERYTAAATAVALGEYAPDLRPVVALNLGSEQRSLLHQMHEASDWVFTIDRNLGVEYFDHGLDTRPEYLIDYAPMPSGRGHRLVVTSRALEELDAMLRPVFSRYHLPESKVSAAVAALRGLSGRLALKLLSSPNDQAEVLGIALAKIYLEYQLALRNQLTIPLDAHPEFYRDGDGLDLAVRRTDLALFDLDEETRTLTCRLVEIKCYRDAGTVHHYEALKTSIAEQIDHSQQRLTALFTPAGEHLATPTLRALALKQLLTSYKERAQRYKALDDDIAVEYDRFLDTFTEGYTLNFAKAALIFDFSHGGTEVETQTGVEYHRIGVDGIHELLGLLPVAAETTHFDMTPSTTGTLPVLAQAAFLPSDRKRGDRTETLRQLQNAGQSGERTEQRAVPAAHTEVKEEQGSQEPSVPPSADQRPQSAEEPSITPTFPDTQAPSQEIRLIESDPLSATPGETLTSASEVNYQVILGTHRKTPQYGLLGEYSGRLVALDLNETHTISLFGVQGGGKSYTLGSVVEMATMSIPHVNVLPSPLATVIFHYSQTQEYKPEFVSMNAANDDAAQLTLLKERYGASPQALTDVVLLVPQTKVEERRQEFPGVEVRPLLFQASELQASHWKFLMNAVGNNATYIRQLGRIMREHRHELTVERLQEAVEASSLSGTLKELARQRLELAAEYIGTGDKIGELAQPGRLIIVDLRDEFIEKDEALGLFVVLLQLFGDARSAGGPFNKLVVFDEAHKYISDADLVGSLVEVIREMRHKGTSILIASQDPPSVPIEVIELSTQIILHKFNSPAWLRHIQKANTALADLTSEKLAQLRPGEAFVWSSKASDAGFSDRAIKVKLRPRVTRHGGGTRTAT